MQEMQFDPWGGKTPGEGNNNPLQYSCLENSMDGDAWQATQSMGLQRGHNLATKQQSQIYAAPTYVHPSTSKTQVFNKLVDLNLIARPWKAAWDSSIHKAGQRRNLFQHPWSNTCHSCSSPVLCDTCSWAPAGLPGTAAAAKGLCEGRGGHLPGEPLLQLPQALPGRRYRH